MSGSYDYYFTFTQDDGASWSDSFRLTDHNDNALSAKYHKMDLLVSDKTYFAFTEETDVFNEERSDRNIYVRKTLSEDYPEDPYVKITGLKKSNGMVNLIEIIHHRHGAIQLSHQVLQNLSQTH